MAFFYISGVLFRASALCLCVVGLISLFVRPHPSWFARSVSLLAFVLIGTSFVIVSAYGAEFFIATRSTNRFERLTFYAARFQNWYYWFEIVAALLPQLFWFTPLRRRPTAIIGISIGSVAPRLFEYAVVAITEYARPS